MHCDLLPPLARKITKCIHSSKPALLNHPIPTEIFHPFSFFFFFVFNIWIWPLYISKSDNNFRKSVMICQIIDSVDNHYGEYLWQFLVVRLYSWHNSKEPADCKLIHETVQHAELSQTRDAIRYFCAIRWHQAPKPKLFYWDITKAKLVSLTLLLLIAFI